MGIIDDSYISYINLDHRRDRNQHMAAELDRVGLSATRTRGMLPQEYNGDSDVRTMRNRTPGAIGCHFSQVKIMQDALIREKHAMVLEDDLVFCDDFHDRMKTVSGFTQTHPWDVIWLGATFHYEPTWHHSKVSGHLHPSMNGKCDCHLNRDFEPTDTAEIVRTYGCWSTYAYIVNSTSIPNILNLLDDYVQESMGIDWLFIKLSPQLFTYSFIPGCVKQMDGQSDIGSGITKFSGFSQLGEYWFQPLRFDSAQLKKFHK